ncbi:tetratricopeptide repeat protein [Pedobacter frigoris]|uniref:Tetratricopeptide repeat protein n=1 Tax=Pedobacter frigoris TaxID=2571272 RepID=A0A4U1CM80_9SPHI|nr:tetratricopeptide repeat protein [Pedobacter frigoris]TKC07461.1 tetratricopeptide repeat protein [Pedobacter frigoris]
MNNLITNRFISCFLTNFISLKLKQAFLVLLFLIVNVAAMAQGISKQELNKKIAEAKQKMGQGNLSNEAFMKKMMQSVPKEQTKGTIAASPLYFPKLNLAALQRIPKKTLSKAELASLVNKILGEVEAKVEPSEFKMVSLLIDTMKNQPDSLGQMAVLLFHNGAPFQALYISGKVVLMNSDNELNINNFGSMLNLSGKEEWAIPVLKSILKGNEKNAMLLNNIGQSFAGLGQRDSALYYFDRCLKENPSQAAARSTAARIQILEGNKTKAAELLENSADEIPLEEMEELSNYVKLKNPPLFTPFKKVPDYFNLYKFKYPEFQTNVYDYEKAYLAQDEFKNLIDVEIARLQEIIQHEQELGKESIKRMSSPQIPPIVARAIKMMNSGYTNSGQLMAMAAAKTNYDLARRDARQRYNAIIVELDSIYSEKIQNLTKKVGEGGAVYREGVEEVRKELCSKKNSKANAFLIELAGICEEFTQKQLNYAAQRFHFESKWNRLAGLNEHMATANYYQAAVRYLQSIRLVNDYDLIRPFCNDYDQDMNKLFDRTAIFISGCPLSLNFSAGPISYKLNCQSVAFSWTTQIRFKFTKNFETKKSQVQLGLGHQFKKGGNVKLTPGVDATAVGKVDVAAVGYIDFDGNGNVSDVGVKGVVVAAANVGLEFKVIPKKGGEQAPIKDYEMTNPKLTIGGEVAAEGSLGINSGATIKAMGLEANWK